MVFLLFGAFSWGLYPMGYLAQPSPPTGRAYFLGSYPSRWDRERRNRLGYSGESIRGTIRARGHGDDRGVGGAARIGRRRRGLPVRGARGANAGTSGSRRRPASSACSRSSQVSAGIWHGAQRADAIVASIFIGLGACLGGFALASSLLPSLTRRAPSASPREPARSDGLSHRDPAGRRGTRGLRARRRLGGLRRCSTLPTSLCPPTPPACSSTPPSAPATGQLGGSPARPTVRSLAMATSLLMQDTAVRPAGPRRLLRRRALARR